MKITGHAAVVTGAASGLGRACATALRQAGARVACLDINEDITRVAPGASALGIVCDVGDAESMQRAFDAARLAHGAARILVNCAAIGQLEPVIGPAGPMPLEHFIEVVRVNLVGTFNALRLAAADMAGLAPCEDGSRGIIINVASGAGHEGCSGQAAYVASKGGIISMTLALAREFGNLGIRVVTISPGAMRTPMMDSVPGELVAELVAQAPFPKRLGEPAEFAALVLHVCENSFVNGAVIRFDAAVRLPYGGQFHSAGLASTG